MNREVHVRFCERFRGETPLYLLDIFLEVVNNLFVVRIFLLEVVIFLFAVSINLNGVKIFLF